MVFPFPPRCWRFDPHLGVGWQVAAVHNRLDAARHRFRVAGDMFQRSYYFFFAACAIVGFIVNSLSSGTDAELAKSLSNLRSLSKMATFWNLATTAGIAVYLAVACALSGHEVTAVVVIADMILDIVVIEVIAAIASTTKPSSP